MKNETKTAEEFIREKIRLKYNAVNKMTKALWTYGVNGEECLRWAKEFSDLQLTQQQSANAKLKKQNEELVKLVIKMYNLTEKIGIDLESKYWTEEFRNEFNPIMTEAENLIDKHTTK